MPVRYTAVARHCAVEAYMLQTTVFPISDRVYATGYCWVA